MKSGLGYLAMAVLISLGTLPMKAQKLQAIRYHYSTDDGLSSNVIAEMAQDDYGYLWFATGNGLTRYDGYTFYNYQTGAGSKIPNLHNRVIHMAIDNQQNVWLRMYDDRVFLLKRVSDCIINPFEHIKGSEEFRTTHPIYTTSNGDALISVDHVGLYRMRVEKDRINAQLINTDHLIVTSIAEGYQDDIWLGTNHGVHRLDASNLTIEKKGLFTDESITSLYSNGYSIYVGTEKGTIYEFSYGQDPTVIRTGSAPIIKLFVDSHGLIWFTDARMGVSKVDPASLTEKHFTQEVRFPDYGGYGGVFAENNGIVWVSMNRGGFGYYNREKDEIEYFHNDPSNPWNLSNTVNAMLVTNEGVVFESTAKRGIEKLEIINNNIERVKLVPNSTSVLDNEIRGVFYDKAKRKLLLSNKAGSLFIVNEDQSKTQYTQADDGTPFGRIYGINKDSKGNYWLSSKDNGLFRMTPTAGGYRIKNWKHSQDDQGSLSSNQVYSSVEDKQGNIWVATFGGGVNILPKGEQQFIHPRKGIKNYPVSSYMKVRTLAIDINGCVWAGTTDGILYLTYNKGKVEVKKQVNSEEQPDHILMSRDIVSLKSDIHGIMWIATNGGGLAHTIGQDAQGRWLFDHIGTKDGLPSDEIKALTFDTQGKVWFTTDYNICSYDIGKNIISAYSNLEGVDETICSEASAITLPNGHILFGTIDGYYIVDHDKLVNSTGSILKLRITDCWINEDIQSPRYSDLYDYYIPDAKSVTLPSHDASIAFRFASLNYQLQHRVHYQYMLEGYDTEWINADKDRIVWYETLPEGTYKFKVRAFLIDSPDKFDQKEIEVIVPPIFMLSHQALWIYLVIGAIIAIILMFNIQNRRAKKELLRRKDEEAHLTESELRLLKAQDLLKNTNDSIADISFNTGFANASQFNLLFQEKTGMTPSQYRDKYKKEE